VVIDVISMPSILIVDDYEMNVVIAQDMLESVGFCVMTDSDGSSAIKQMSQFSFHCVLLDLHMPGMSGFDVMVAMKLDSNLRKIPVIGFSASSRPEDRQAALDSGMLDFVTKPFVSHVLIQKIVSLIENNGHSFGDISGLKSNCDDDAFKVIKYLAKFRDAMALNSILLQDFFVADDLDGILFLAHKVKSSCRFVGAYQLADVFESIEAVAPLSDKKQMHQLLLQASQLLRLYNLKIDMLIANDALINH